MHAMESPQKHRKTLWVSLVVFVLLMALGGGYFVWQSRTPKQQDTSSTSPKLIFLGIDGAHWPYIKELMDKGEMPNLKKLIDNGVMATPVPLHPANSPALWTSIATGDKAAKHGVNNFLSTSGAEDEYTLISSSDRHVKAIWNILTEHDFRVGVFGWTASWPLEPTTGYTVSDVAILDPKKGITPDALFRGMVQNSILTTGFATLADGLPLDFPVPNDINDAAFFEAVHKKFDLFNRLFNSNAVYAFHRMEPDILFQEDDVIDAIHHLFLKFKRPEEFKGYVDPELIRLYGGFIDDVYRSKDAYIGEFMKTADENTHIIVASDHGTFMDPAAGYRFDKLNIMLEIMGLLKKHEDGSIDFAHTIAFECNNNTFDWERRLCINLKDRQSGGIVEQVDFERTRTDILHRLQSIKTTDGTTLFTKISASNQTDADIVYDIRRTITDQTLSVEGREFPVKTFMTLAIESGNHYADPEAPNAFFVWMGPGIRKGVVVEDLEMTDYVPNILYALGLPIGQDMDGQFRSSLFEHPGTPQYIPSYEDHPEKFISGNHGLLSEEDVISLDGATASITTTISETGSYKQFCFGVPALEGYDIRVNSLQSDEQPVDFLKTHSLSSLPHYDVQVFEPEDFDIPPSDAHDYTLTSPAEPNRNYYLSAWTNMSFTVPVRRSGVMRFLAKGDAAAGEDPVLTLKLNGVDLPSIVVDSASWTYYDVPLPASGTLSVSYQNDFVNGGGDRNVYIDGLLFSRTGMFHPEEDVALFTQGQELCLYDAKKGTIQFEAAIGKEKSSEEEDLGRTDALKVLQETGVIPNR